ncbi:hypothetical protein [Nostoc sp. FACHB-190]|nr:hypothetical protein [Nostoc sp. FACHB-190]MBD2303616.1 hypothetical protein [Nostoc sp. FACHB-190]
MDSSKWMEAAIVCNDYAESLDERTELYLLILATGLVISLSFIATNLKPE